MGYVIWAMWVTLVAGDMGVYAIIVCEMGVCAVIICKMGVFAVIVCKKKYLRSDSSQFRLKRDFSLQWNFRRGIELIKYCSKWNFRLVRIFLNIFSFGLRGVACLL